MIVHFVRISVPLFTFSGKKQPTTVYKCHPASPFFFVALKARQSIRFMWNMQFVIADK